MKKFYAIIGNPPYQEETTQKEPTSNGQKPVKSIFNDFQDEADKNSLRIRRACLSRRTLDSPVRQRNARIRSSTD